MIATKTSMRNKKQLGATSLVVVSLLLVVMSTVVIFANKTVIIEQRTSGNQYKQAIAFEAAEAGIAWAQSMLNNPKYITSSCAASTNTSNKRFKERYLASTASGAVSPVFYEANQDNLQYKNTPAKSLNSVVVAACSYNQSGGVTNCSCPDSSAAYTAPSVAAPTTSSGFTPGFAIVFEMAPDYVSGKENHTINLVSYGCTTVINSKTCAGDATSKVTVSLGIVSGMTTPPAAPLTARGNVSIGNAALGVHNPDPGTNGVTINAGGNISADNARISTIPGTPPKSTLVGNDASLRSKTEDEMFVTFFGMGRDAYKNLPTTYVLPCTSCTETDLIAAYNSGYRQIWVNNDMIMNANATIGSSADPFVMIVNGNIQMRGTLRVFGVMYSASITWDNTGGGNALLEGAAIAEGNYTGNGTPDYYYNPLVMNRIRSSAASFVPAPGSWRDF